MLPGGWVGTENEGPIMMDRPLDAGSWSRQLPLPASPHIPTQLPPESPLLWVHLREAVKSPRSIPDCFSMSDHFWWSRHESSLFSLCQRLKGCVLAAQQAPSWLSITPAHHSSQQAPGQWIWAPWESCPRVGLSSRDSGFLWDVRHTLCKAVKNCAVLHWVLLLSPQRQLSWLLVSSEKSK